MGFEDQDVASYAERYFTHHDQADQAPAFLQALKKQPSLQLLSHTPLYLRLFCQLARQESPQALGRTTLATLYQRLIHNFFRYSLERATGKRYAAAEALAQQPMVYAYLRQLA